MCPQSYCVIDFGTSTLNRQTDKQRTATWRSKMKREITTRLSFMSCAHTVLCLCIVNIMCARRTLFLLLCFRPLHPLLHGFKIYRVFIRYCLFLRDLRIFSLVSSLFELALHGFPSFVSVCTA